MVIQSPPQRDDRISPRHPAKNLVEGLLVGHVNEMPAVHAPLCCMGHIGNRIERNVQDFCDFLSIGKTWLFYLSPEKAGEIAAVDSSQFTCSRSREPTVSQETFDLFAIENHRPIPVQTNREMRIHAHFSRSRAQ